MKRVYTIGHSTQTVEEFINKLKLHEINCIGDVRSVPYSQYAADYNSEKLKHVLNENGIAYVFLGDEFGARRSDRSLYGPDGKLDFEKTANTDLFKQGVKRLEAGIDKGFNIALMCSEKRPEDCHRCIMVGHALSDLGFEVDNILENGSIEEQHEIDKLLLSKYPEIFQITIGEGPINEGDDIKKAYRCRASEIAFRLQDLGQ